MSAVYVDGEVLGVTVHTKSGDVIVFGSSVKHQQQVNAHPMATTSSLSSIHKDPIHNTGAAHSSFSNTAMQSPILKNHSRRVSASPQMALNHVPITESSSAHGIHDPTSMRNPCVLNNPYRRTTNTSAEQEKSKSWEELRAFIGKDNFLHFTAAFLKSSVSEHVHNDLWSVLCDRFHIAKSMKPIQACYENPNEHFEVRAALILEETRHIISCALQERWKISAQQKKKQNHKPICVMILETIKRKHGITILRFQAGLRGLEMKGKVMYFGTAGKEILVNGALFECLAFEDDQNRDISKSVLGCIIPSSPQKLQETGQIEIMILEPVPSQKSKRALHFVFTI
jgi:hypothetical protein